MGDVRVLRVVGDKFSAWSWAHRREDEGGFDLLLRLRGQLWVQYAGGSQRGQDVGWGGFGLEEPIRRYREGQISLSISTVQPGHHSGQSGPRATAVRGLVLSVAEDSPLSPRSCMDRHDGGVNCLFLDWSVRKVGLKELWTLKWVKPWPTAGPWTKRGGVRPGGLAAMDAAVQGLLIQERRPDMSFLRKQESRNHGSEVLLRIHPGQ